MFYYTETLKHIVCGIVEGTISNQEIDDLLVKLSSRHAWNCDKMLITDCYFTLKHRYEEQIRKCEWQYFLECFNGARKYNLDDKLKQTAP